ncbi:MAG: hypothetical protein KF720_09725 [Rubrivivax sp.]|nr:hypothetical protein [Rubrivivax sp.]
MAFDGSVMQAQLCGAVARGARHGVVAAVASACIVAGCGGDDDGSGAPHVGEQAAWVCPEVSDIGTLPGLLYVSPTGTDGSSCGGPSNPCKTLEYAFSLAGPSGSGYQNVMLRHGLYPVSETIVMQGVSLYGGCRLASEPDRKYRSVILASAAPGQPDPVPVLNATYGAPWISSVVVIAPDVAASGSASVAMTIGNAANVTLQATVLVAGKGASGGSLPQAGNTSAQPCFTPGGVASDSLWGQVDLVSLNWVAGIGGAGTPGYITPSPFPTVPLQGAGGGQQGGASIGLLLVNSNAVSSVPGKFNRILGDAGGAGGAGQSGLSQSDVGVTSGGAGGNGGPSIGIAVVNSPAGVSSDFAYTYASAGGAPGAGGAGVNPGGCSSDSGAPGVSGGSAPVHTFTLPSTLAPGQSLASGQSLYSPDLGTRFTFQKDGNLCLYSAGKVRWCTHTVAQGLTQVNMQTDGNVCIYAYMEPWPPSFCSQTNSHPGAYLTVQDSGQVQVIGSDGTPWWTKP